VVGEDAIRHLLASKFIADPGFKVEVNGVRLQLDDLDDAVSEKEVEVPGYGNITVMKVHSSPGRTSRQHGIAWWVNGRLVGNHSWDTVEGQVLDGRKTLAKSLTYIVKADLLIPGQDITADWTEFIPTERVKQLHSAVTDYIRTSLQTELEGERKERKRTILKENRKVLRKISPVSQEVIASFIDEVQLHCPTIQDTVLQNAAEVLIKLETARSGYSLLERLSKLSPDDLDAWNEVMEEWTADDAKKVLDTLKFRMKLILELEQLVEDKATDELHELQPLFEKGLWIFGPEYESICFRSNRALSPSFPVRPRF
jgi:hypothetical protein